MSYHAINRKLPAAMAIVIAWAIAGCNIVHVDSRNEKPPKAMADTGRIRLEHVAINVKDPEGMAKWYCENLGMKVVRQGPPPVHMRFIADAGENMMLEIYHNPAEAVPDYASMNPLSLHIAFMVDDVKKTCRRLTAAGATVHEDAYTTESGDELAMLRDPWGVPIQFVKRAKPMLSHK